MNGIPQYLKTMTTTHLTTRLVSGPCTASKTFNLDFGVTFPDAVRLRVRTTVSQDSKIDTYVNYR